MREGMDLVLSMYFVSQLEPSYMAMMTNGSDVKYSCSAHKNILYRDRWLGIGVTAAQTDS